MMKNFINWLKSPKSDFILFVIVLVLLNLVAQNAFFRIDLTESKAFSLSDASKMTVSTLDKPLAVKVFFTSNLNAPYNTVEQYLKDLLNEYKSASNKYFTCEFYDMEDAENQSMAREYGIQQVSLQQVDDNEINFRNAYMGAAFIYGDSIEVLDNITSTDSLEYNITSRISGMITTNDILSGLQEEIQLKLFVSPALGNFNISGFSQIEQYVVNAWSEVNGKNQGKIAYSRIEPSSGEVDALAEKYGIQALSWKDKSGTTQKGAIGLVLEKGSSFRLIPLEMGASIMGYTMYGLDSLEDNIADGLKSLISKSVEIGYITGHGERDLITQDYYSAVAFQDLLSDTYSLKTLELTEDSIPASMSTIVINGPKTAFTEEELYKIDQFLMKGGNLMVMLDPYEEVESQSFFGYMPQYNEIDTGLEALLEKYGVTLGEGYVFDTQCYNYYSSTQKLPLNWAPVVMDTGVNQKSVITKNLGELIFLEHGPMTINRENSSSFTATVLAETSDAAWTDTDFFILDPSYISEPASDEGRGKQPLAILLEGSFESAFDAPPAAVNSEDDADGVEAVEATTTDDSGITASSHLAKSLQAGKIFVSYSSTMSTSQLVSDATQPISIFVRNVVDYLNGAEELCSMRTKSLSVRTMDISNKSLVSFMKLFNMAGLIIIVLLIALAIWRMRAAKRRAIRLRYCPDDFRDNDNIRIAEKAAAKKEKNEQKGDADR